jgi:hypothetical protein
VRARLPLPKDPVRRDALAVAAVATLALIVLDALVRDAGAPKGDDLIYELMARHPFDPHTFPFAYRIGVPYLVHVLPFSHTFSFSLIAWLCSGAAGGFAYILMRDVGAPRRLSIGLAFALVLCPPMFVASLRQGRSTDPAMILAMVAATVYIVERKPVALAVTIALGALTRESAMFLIPFAYAMWAERLVDLKTARRVALVSAPAVAIYVGLRLGIPVASNRYTSVGEVIRTGLEGWQVQLRRLFIDFGPLWFIAPFALRDMRFARRGLVLIGLCVVSMGFALDWGRIFFVAAPVFYGASAWVLRDRPRLHAPVLAAWAVLILVYAVYMQVHGVQHGIIEIGPPAYPVQ